MKNTFYNFLDLIEVEVSESYMWKDTLFVEHICKKSDVHNDGLKGYIEIEKIENIDLKNVRSIGDDYFIGDNIYVDKKFGVILKRCSENKIKLSVTQECNEWLIIAFELMLLQQEKTIIHAASVEKDGKVLLMPSWGGVGKTATVCTFVNNGWKLLGDDLVVIDKNKNAIPFLKPFVIYPYHKAIFPQLFSSSSKNHIIKNTKFSSVLGSFIPAIKRTLRPFPKILAYLRKHNPQSMRVSPLDIFASDEISAGGTIKSVLWLERSSAGVDLYRECSQKEITSKTCMVTASEIFAEKLNSIFHLAGCGIFSYDETIGKIYDIVFNACSKSCNVYEIPTSISIDKVGGMVFNKVSESIGE